MQNKQRFEEITRGDILLGVAFIILIAFFFVWSSCYFTATGTEDVLDENTVVTIEQAGEVVGICSLNQEKEIFTQWNGHKNTIVISNGSVIVKDANCPDKYCEKHVPISKTHESIVCLPAHLVVTITNGKAGDVDAVSN